jgi:methionyl-tRNA formyltransferase
MGTPHYAEEILRALIEAGDMEVSLVLTQPDKPVGRKRMLTPPPVKVLAQEHYIDVLQPNHLREDGIRDSIVAAEADFIIVAAFGQLLPKDILDIAPCINLHASLLPRYRGASPVQQSLLNGDKMTGVTSMLMEEGLDTGDILEMVEFEIPRDMRLHALMERLTHEAADLTLRTIRNFQEITPIPQDDSAASYCKKIRRADGEIDFASATEVYNKYRAFEGWPGIFSADGIKFEDISLLDDRGEYIPREILEFAGDAVVVGCAKGKLKVGQMQPPSKKMVNARGYCAGRGLKVGDNIV